MKAHDIALENSSRVSPWRLARRAGIGLLSVLLLFGSIATVQAQDPNTGREGQNFDLNVIQRLFQNEGAQIAITTVPDLSGLSSEEAGKKTRDSGLRLSAGDIKLPAPPRYRVVRQRPAAGSRVARNSVVTVALQVWAQVPDVTRGDVDSAVAKVRATRLDPNVAGKIETSEHPAGRVLRQAPKPGTWVRPKTRVDLWIADAAAAPVQRVRVPNLSGMTVPRAKERLAAVGLLLQPRNAEATAAPRYRIRSQRPAAGDLVYPKTPVVVTTAAFVQVPHVVNSTREGAVAKIRAANLDPAIANPAEAPKYPAGQVLRQSPEAGSWVRPKTRVDLWLAKAAAVRVPNLIGLTLPDARAKAAASRLVLRQDAVLGSDEPQHRVIRQSLAPQSEVPAGSPIHVETVAYVQVPALRGLSPAEAERRLDEFGLNARIGSRREGKVSREIVQGQEPKAGNWVRRETIVSLAVAIPQVVQSIPAPDIVGQTAADAENLLARLGLEFRPRSDWTIQPERDRVVSQSPHAGSPLNPGDRVTATVKPDLVAVPDLRHETLAQARALLAQAQLEIAFRRPAEGDLTRYRVETQLPFAKAQVRPGSKVTVELALIPVTVPNVVGERRDSAVQILQRSGLEFLLTGGFDLDNEFTNVETQTPQAGQTVPLGTEITLDVVSLLVAVPAVEELARDQAEAAIQAAGLQVRLIGDGSLAVTQQPAAGTEVLRGSNVTLTLAYPPETVPDVIGLTRAEAIKRITLAGFVADPLGETDTGLARVGDQRPPAGATAPRDSKVTIVLRVSILEIALEWLGEQQEWLLAGAGLLMAAIGIALLKSPPPPVVPSRVVVQPAADPGEQSVESDEPLGRGPNIRLRPRIDRGRQLLVLENDENDGEEQRYG